MLGDGISMGVGDYLSSSAEYEFAKRERARELWECENDIEAERREMVELYSMKAGISPEDAKTVVGIISRDHHTFVDIMMVEELGLMPPEETDASWKNGLVTFGAFCLFGTVPLLPYIGHVSVFGPDGTALAEHPAFGIAIALTAVCMFLLGASTSRFTAQHWLRAGLFTMVNGGLAAAASFGIAVLVNYLFGVSV
jgi:VIT1/CCC1 family predicted Fe2+/Mn2+ transporter